MDDGTEPGLPLQEETRSSWESAIQPGAMEAEAMDKGRCEVFTKVRRAGVSCC